MATPDDVARELNSDQDAWTLYDGAQGLKFNDAGLRTGSLRRALMRTAWDYLRFQTVSTFKGRIPADAKFGQRDAVTRILYATELIDQKLDRIAAALKVDVSDLKA